MGPNIINTNLQHCNNTPEVEGDHWLTNLVQVFIHCIQRKKSILALSLEQCKLINKHTSGHSDLFLNILSIKNVLISVKCQNMF